MTDTILVMLGTGVAPYSARGLQQTLEPIDIAANLRRNINGALIDLSASQMLKYKSTITANDQKPPACDGVWPGRLVVVDCVSELAYEEYSAPQRPVVEGSQYTELGFTFYRPRLTMMVTSFSIQTDEWAAQVGWTMTLEER